MQVSCSKDALIVAYDFLVYNLRLADEADIPALGDLMLRSMGQIGPLFYTPEQAEAAAKFLTIPDPTIIGDRTYFVVDRDGRIVGCGGWSKRRKLFTGSLEQETLSGDFLDPSTEAAKVRAMFVDPDHTRQGIGESIFVACEQAALEAGFSKIELMATLPGVPFYRRMGCLEEGEEDVQLPDGSLLPCLRMYKLLNK